MSGEVLDGSLSGNTDVVQLLRGAAGSSANVW